MMPYVSFPVMGPKMAVLVLLLVSCFIAFMLMDVARMKREGDAVRANDKAAERLWLKDCAAMNRAVDDCAKAWDRGGTLYRLYLQKAVQANGDPT